MSSDTFHKSFLIGLIVALMAALIFAYARTAPTGPVFPRGNLTFQRADGTTIPLDIEIATTPAQTEYGLMFRRFLPPHAGMLFLFTPAQPVSFWMKNTFIPLDMLFVQEDGTITKIVTRAQPFSLAHINSGDPVRAVIEINGGAADQWGLKTSDKVLYPAFSSQ
jgi:uncharacterized membrane protein (UPF0127 family)